ncbi:MAG: CotH kinase family protein, partial [Lachnospiraceae bacterium]|nr:CotH kinase family protein [Lachnospiraceae bacterium]
MRKNNFLKRLFVPVLSSAMILSNISTAGVANAAKTVEESDAGASATTFNSDAGASATTFNSDAGSDTNSDVLNATRQEADVLESDGSNEEEQIEYTGDPLDPFQFTYLQESFNNNGLTTTGENVDFEIEDTENNIKGLVVSGKCEDFNTASVTFNNYMDFGESTIDKIRIDGLAQHGRNITLKIYFDNDEYPAYETQLNPCTTDDGWETSSVIFEELPQYIYGGKHYMKIVFQDNSSNEDAKTSALLRSIRFYKKSIPTVSFNLDESLGTIDAMNSSEDKSAACYGDVSIDVPEDFTGSYSDEGLEDYSGGNYTLEYIKGRGNSTWTTTKKPYKFKLTEKADLFGMGKSKQWVLLANYYDNSLIRNYITYHLGDMLGYEYTPHLVPVDLFMNGKYLGNYFLCEKIQVAASRIDIDNLEEIEAGDDNITGGYLMSFNSGQVNEGYLLETKHSEGFRIESPSALTNEDVDPTLLDDMRDYIGNYMIQTENAIFGDDFKDETGKSYQDYMDINSAAKYYLLQAFTCNADAYETDSTYCYKKKDDKLYFGPLWDFDYVAWADNAFENPEKEPSVYQYYSINFKWFKKLLHDESFKNAVLEAWGSEDVTDENTFYYQINELIKDGGIIDQYASMLEDSVESNFDVPGSNYFVLGTETGECTSNTGEFNTNTYVENTDDIIKYSNAANYTKEINRLKTWIKYRLSWFNDFIETLGTEEDEDYKIKLYDGDNLITTIQKYESGFLEASEIPSLEATEDKYFTGWYGDVAAFGDDEGTTEYGQLTDQLFINRDYEFHAEWVDKDTIPEVSDIIFNYSDIYMKPETALTLKYKISPSLIETYDVTLTSSDESIVKVGIGNLLLAQNTPGDAVITLKTINGTTAEVNVHIVDASEACEAFSIVASQSSIELNVGETGKIDFSFEPENAITFEKNIINADPEIAVMDEFGIVTAKSPGTAKVYLFGTNNNDYTQIDITVLGTAEETDEPSGSESPDASANASKAPSESDSNTSASPEGSAVPGENPP